METIAIIPADEAEPVHFEEVRSIDLKVLQQHVGGYIEMVYGQWDTCLYLNEDGRALALPPNPRAARLWGGSIVGRVVVTGGVDDDGYDLGLTEEQIEHLKKSTTEEKQ